MAYANSIVGSNLRTSQTVGKKPIVVRVPEPEVVYTPPKVVVDVITQKPKVEIVPTPETTVTNKIVLSDNVPTVTRQTTQTITNTNDMTVFSKTLVGKLIGKASNVASVIASPNPIMAAASALKGGVATAKKEEVTQAKEVQNAVRSMPSGTQSAEGTQGGMLTKPYTFLKLTFPLWIWGAIVVVVLFLLYKFVFKRFMGGSTRRGSTTRRSGTSSARARMARVRSFRRKRK